MRALLLTLNISLLLAALAAADANAAGDPRLVGRWYGETVEDGNFRQWINERRADGTFRVESQMFVGCSPSGVQVERGTWRYADGRLLAITTHVNEKPTNTRDKRFRDWYEVANLTATGADYVHERTGEHYTARRVSPNFEFPSSCKIDKLQ